MQLDDFRHVELLRSQKLQNTARDARYYGGPRQRVS
jgi:hypothetical protein